MILNTATRDFESPNDLSQTFSLLGLPASVGQGVPGAASPRSKR
jgi:hypothetical protein